MFQQIFITHLHYIKGKSVIIVVVDRLTKFCHIGTLPAGYTSRMVSKFFVENIIKLLGIPSTIISDRDKVFISSFWREIHRLSGTTLKLSTAYHPETDG